MSSILLGAGLFDYSSRQSGGGGARQSHLRKKAGSRHLTLYLRSSSVGRLNSRCSRLVRISSTNSRQSSCGGSGGRLLGMDTDSSLSEARSHNACRTSIRKPHCRSSRHDARPKVRCRRRWKISLPCRASNPRRVGPHEMVMGSRGAQNAPLPRGQRLGIQRGRHAPWSMGFGESEVSSDGVLMARCRKHTTAGGCTGGAQRSPCQDALYYSAHLAVSIRTENLYKPAALAPCRRIKMTGHERFT